MCSLDRDGLQLISEAMKINQSIRCLDLSYNNISDSNGDILAKLVSY